MSWTGLYVRVPFAPIKSWWFVTRPSDRSFVFWKTKPSFLATMWYVLVRCHLRVLKPRRFQVASRELPWSHWSRPWRLLLMAEFFLFIFLVDVGSTLPPISTPWFVSFCFIGKSRWDCYSCPWFIICCLHYSDLIGSHLKWWLTLGNFCKMIPIDSNVLQPGKQLVLNNY